MWNAARVFHGLKSPLEHDIVKGMVGVMRQIVVSIPMHHGQAMRDRARDQLHVQFNPTGITPPVAKEMVNQRAITTANIQHTGAGFDHFSNQFLVKAH